MSVGAPRGRIALAFVDELLHDFPPESGKQGSASATTSKQQPSRTTQQIFQRLLVACGLNPRCVAVHAVQVLLRAVGFSQEHPALSLLPSPARPLSETQAAQLLGLVVEYAICCKGGGNRSAVEYRGVLALFDALANGVSNCLVKTSVKDIHLHEENLINKVLCNVEQSYQCVFLCCIGPAVEVIKNVVEAQLLHYLANFAIRDNSKCDFRIDFVIRLLSCYCAHDFPSVDPELVRAFLRRICIDYEEHKSLIQPFVCLLIYKKVKLNYQITEEGLRSQITQLLSSQEIDTKELREVMSAPNYNLLMIAMQDAGQACTASQDALIALLKKSGLLDPALIGPSTVANAVLMMIRTSIASPSSGSQPVITSSWDRAGPAAIAGALEASGVAQNWDGKVFTRAIDSINPQLNWTEVIMRLDQEGFLLSERRSLVLLTNILTEAFVIKNAPFPTNTMFREWNFNRVGQLSWLEQIILHPDVFCFADYPHTPVVITCLKVQPDDKNKSVANWRALNLTEALLKIGDDASLSTAVLKIFQVALSICPDILLLAMTQMQGPICNMRTHLIQANCPMLLSASHQNAIPVFNAMWNSEGPNKTTYRHFILQSLYNFNTPSSDDLSRLIKVLEIGHELKPNGLTELLNLPKFNFTVDLACLASKRDFLKLDKWLDDKTKEHGEPFVQAVIHHMRRRLPVGLAGGAAPPTMSQETYNTLHNFLSKQSNVFRSIRMEYATLVSQLFDLKMKSEGRSSSASSQGRVPIGGGPPGPPGPGPAGFGGSSSASSPYGGAGGVPGQLNLGGSLFAGLPSSGAFGSSAPLFQQRNGNQSGPAHDSAAAAIQALGAVGSGLHSQQSGSGAFSLPGVPPLSMSPSNQMLRSGIPQPPQRQNSGTGWSSQIPTPGALRSTPGATTPQNAVDFQSALPPTSAQHDIQALPRTSAPSAFPDDLSNVTFSDEVQEEVNTYFEQIYATNGGLHVQDLIQKLKYFQQSNVQRERDVLACLVKNLFEEYRFFHDYPERELKTTAEVYGGIIREGIITNLQFATAVRKVIESLQANPQSKLWTFGIVALNACKRKLCCYPKVCSMIMQHENFSKFPPNLSSYVRAGVSEKLPQNTGRETPPNWSQAGTASVGQSPAPQRNNSGDGQRPAVPGAVPPGRTGTSVLSYTNVDTLVQATEKEGAEIDKPVEAVLDKVYFLFNNLSQANLDPKKDEMRGLIRENGDMFVRWLAQYIVMKRVSIEQNFQPLYNNFAQAIDDPLLDKYIKMETFRNIKILLRSDKRQAASNYSDRQLLKNLGLWLGAVTISRNRPITVSELDLKSLLMEAYYKGQPELLFVVPFIAKILISCAKTPIFSATSAWIRSILKILAELHNEPDLKINLKFEIEVLCKELSIDLQSLPIEGVLKDTERLVRLPQQLSDLTMLQQPDTGSSPVPSHTRIPGGPAISTGGTTTPHEHPAMGGSDTKPSTPLPGSEPAPEQTEVGPSPAHFAYHEINVVSFEGIVPHLKIPAHLPLFQLHPQLKHVIKPAVNHAIKELIGPVTERALKVAMTVTEHVVKKDFALDGDDQKMRRAGHHMMRAMTAGMAAITCRDPLQTTLQTYLVQAFMNSLRNANTSENKQMIDDAAMSIVLENLELATNFIVKTACEKATPELDKRLENELTLRANAARDQKEFTGDANALAAQNSVPEKIKIRPGAISKEQLAVYEEFSTKICGFKPTNADDMIPDFAGAKSAAIGLPLQNAEVDKLVQNLLALAREADNLVTTNPAPQSKAFVSVAQIRDMLVQLASMVRNGIYLHNLVHRGTEQFLHGYHVEKSSQGIEIEWARRLRDVYLSVIRVLVAQLGLSELQRRITAVLVQCQVEYRFNHEAIDFLYRNQLILTPIYDQHLAHVIESGSFEAAIFAQKLIKSLNDHFNQPNVLREKFPQVIEQIHKLQQFGAHRPTPDPTSVASPAVFPDRPTTLAGYPAGSGTPPNLPQGAEFAPQDVELQAKVEAILRDWISLCYTPLAQIDPQQALAKIIHLMHEHGVLSTDDMITRFFRMCTEMCVDVSYRLLKVETATSANTVVRQRCYYTLDAFVKLTCLMVKFSDGSQHQTKINLLKKVLNIVTSVLLNDHELRREGFHAVPYHRILIIMFQELTQPDPSLDPIAWPILEAFGQALFILQPRRAPRFSYAWLDIVGHRTVIARLLGVQPGNETVDAMKTSAMYTQLMVCHLKFLAPFLRNIELPKSIAYLYKGTLRVLLVVLHDFPELLCDYHYVLCDTIPPNCVQLRNLVLSAYPRNMRLPDPFALNFKQVDAITEMAIEPKRNILNMTSIIPQEMRQQLDSYLASRSNVELLSTLPNMLQVSGTPGSKYNTTVLNAVVLYVGMRAIDAIHSRDQRISMTTIAHTSFMDIFQNLAVRLCTEGRYLLFNAIANQLRYPNAHTHYFSCTLLFLFQQADMNVMKEQITRILFERLVALRPHPWGLLITFIELIRNPQYNFWAHEFTRCAPEIERLFRNVAQTCIAASREQPAPAAAGSTASVAK